MQDNQDKENMKQDLITYGLYWSIRINQDQSWACLGPFGVSLRRQVLLHASIDLTLSTSEPNFVFQISQPPNIAQWHRTGSVLKIYIHILILWRKKTPFICH